MKPTVLVVNDDMRFSVDLRATTKNKPYELTVVQSARDGLHVLRSSTVNVLICDDRPKGMSGLALLSIAKQLDPACLRILLIEEEATARAAHALQAVNLFRFLFKPCSVSDVNKTILDALRARREHAEFHAAVPSTSSALVDEVIAPQIRSALRTCHMIYQPVLAVNPDDHGLDHLASGSTFGYEALVRMEHPIYSTPKLLIDAVHEAGLEYEFDRTVRNLVAKDMSASASTLDPKATVFVNMLTKSLQDPKLLDGLDPLHRFAKRVVLEVSERTPLSVLGDLQSTARELRRHGYRLGLDDLASGPTGLEVFGRLSPGVVKFDISRMRGIYQSRAKSKTIVSMIQTCKQLGCLTLAERVESRQEFEYLVELGVELFQGHYIGRPSAGFTPVMTGVHNQMSYGSGRSR